MDVTDRLVPVLAAVAGAAADVDAQARFPQKAVDALRTSGLCGLTLPTDSPCDHRPSVQMTSDLPSK